MGDKFVPDELKPLKFVSLSVECIFFFFKGFQSVIQIEAAAEPQGNSVSQIPTIQRLDYQA